MPKKVIIILGAVVFLIVAKNYFKPAQDNIKGLKTENSRPTVRGVILPHHDFAKEIIIELYEKIKNNSYDTVVIIGPNHFYPDLTKIITVDSNSGINIPVQLSRSILKDIDGVQTDNLLVENEHSIGVQLKYIDKYFPEAEILPLVIPGMPDEKDIKNLTDIFIENHQNVLFIASVDFAHDVGYLEGLENNQETIKAIKSSDYQTLSSYGNSHLDSPWSIILLMQIMEKIHAKDFQLIQDTHGGLLADQPGSKATSYITAVFSTP